jgi:hypothetical protein
MAPLASAGSIVTATLTSMALPSVDVGNLYAYGSYVGESAVGGILWQGSPTNTDPVFQGAFVAYCIDITHDISFGGTYQFQETDLASALSASSPQNNPNAVNQIDDLFASDLPGSAVTGVPDNATTEAAFQLSLWNIIYNAPTSPTAIPLDSGAANIFALDNSWADTSALALAHTWLSNLGPTSNSPILTGLAAYSGSQGQVYIGGFTNSGNPANVLVPASPVAAGVLGLLGACALVRGARRRIAL